MFTQFGEKYRKWARVTKATMRIQHKPGDAIEVDWAGDTIPIFDSVTGEQSFPHGEEFPVTQSCNNPGLCKVHRCFSGAFVLWLTNASWNNGSSIVLCQLLVAAVHYHIIPGIGRCRSFAVVRNQKSRCSAKVVKRMNMAVQPILSLRVTANFCIGVVTAGQDCYK